MLKRLLLTTLIFCSAVASGQEALEPSEFTERILLFRTVEGDLLFDGLIAHEIDRTLYISAVDLFEILGFKTELSIDSKIFKATTFTPLINISIKWPDCEMTLNKKTSSVSCSQIKIYEDELFISSEVAGKALKAKFEYLPYKSELRMDTQIDYPKLSTLKRKNKSIQKGRGGDFDPGYKRKDVEAQTLKNIYVDQQLTWNKNNQSDGQVQYYTNLGTDVLQHEIQVTTQGDDEANDFTTWSVRRDFYGSEDNEYVSSYQLGNVLVPTVELIGGPAGGKGFYITNRDQFLINFGQREFEGNLRPDWEVELYVNDNLFDRQSANESGRYRFQNVPVIYGENNFRLEFYGPLGERTTEYINNSVRQENLKKGEFRYEAGALKNDSTDVETLLQTSYGLADNLAAYAGYTRYNLFDQGELRDYAIIGLNGYLKNINYTLFSGADFFNSGNFYAARTQFALRQARIQFTYLDAEDFSSSFIGDRTKFLDKSYELNLNTSIFGRASVLWRAEHEIFDDGSERTTALQNLVLPVGRVNFLLRNDLVEGLDNKLDVIYTYFRNQFRTSAVYDWEQVRTLDFEFRNRFDRESSVSLTYSKSLTDELDSFSAGYQQRFKRFFFGVEANTDLNKAHSILARLRSSFGYTDSQSKIQMSSDELASSGNVCAKVFFDFNSNGILEEGIDRPVSDVSLRWVQGNLDYPTDEKGETFLSNLPLYLPVDVQFLVKSLKDPQLVPVEPGVRVHLQKGQCTELEFLLKRVYDFEGQIFTSDGFPKTRLTVQLMDAYGKILKETRTDSDGYFLFEAQDARAYYLKIKKGDYKVEPEIYVINPYEKESLEQDFYFDVSN
jgi:hypothetical protein